jgi:poly(beta-D-mannuronate) lyase
MSWGSDFSRRAALFLTFTLSACGGAAGTKPGPGIEPPSEDGGSGGGGGGGGGGKGGSTPPATGKKDAAPTTEPTEGPQPDAGSGGSTGTPDTSPPANPGDAGPMAEPEPTEDLPACKKTVMVTSTATLTSAIEAAMPGDCIVMADGNYVVPTITKMGTAEAPIVIKAQNTLKAVMNTGALNIAGSAYVVVQGLTYTSGTPAKVSDCDHCRVSRCRFQLQDGSFDTLSVTGKSVHTRIDHNDFGPKTVLGNTLMLSGAGAQIVQFTRVDHNYFHDVKGGGGNGWETIRAGLSGWTFSSSKTVIEYNLFERCTGDPETISVKSSDNTIRFNTMRNNNGELTLRHGNRALVYGNYFINNATGMRVLGGGHKIFNNYFGNLGGRGLFLEGGSSTDTTGALTDHKQVYDTQVLFNTIVSSRGIDVGGAHPINPKNCTIANNLLQGGAMLTEVAGTVGSVFANNFVNGGASVNTPGAVKMVDPKLMKDGEIFRIGADSPAIDAADPKFTVMDDIDGTPRSGKLDVGADEFQLGGTLKVPLTTKDVGPMAP